MTLVLLNYNKYKNRQFKREETIDDYFEAAKAYEVIEDYDFNPADGVSTSVILGGEYYDYEDKYDYLLVCDGDEIVSRWFILDTDRTRIGQYRVSLQRDCVVDNFEIIANAPAFINKATLNDYDPLIYTKESFSANEIKTKETLLTDETECAWIVGYVSRDYPAEGSSLPIDFTASVIEDINDIDFPYNDGDQYQVFEGAYIQTNIGYINPKAGKTRFDFTRYGDSFTYTKGAAFPEAYRTDKPLTQSYTASVLNQGMAGYTDLKNYVTKPLPNKAWTTEQVARANRNYEGKILLRSNKYYRISIVKTGFTNSGPLTGDPLTAMTACLTAVGFEKVGNPIVASHSSVYTIRLSQIEVGDFNIDFPNKYGRYTLKDAPYDMFCIPYPAIHGSVTYGGCTISNLTAIQFAQGIAKGLGSSLYDLQLLPFCPITVTANGSTLVFDQQEAKRSTEIKLGNTVKGYILWATASQGEKALNVPDITASNLKMANQVDKYRLVSGSYSSAFEINIAKNKGKLKGFSVDYTYIPYNPYIHVNPEFDGLYGEDFDDCRGLIDQGDKSISYLSDAWTQYQINNKTYQQQFDRQIEKMDYDHKYDMAESGINALTSAFGIGMGAGVLGGPAAGVGVGLVSLAAGAADQSINKLRYGANKSYTQDMHDMSLANIKALPSTIAKMTAYSKNNKIFPVLEYYTCTDEEKRAFANYIRYNGMSCGIIGSISDYLNNSWEYDGIKDKGYIEATLLQVEDLPGDNHMVNAINNELERGVYFK